jgi:hypothetical protein
MTRARAQSGPTISLFPFLAVLLCTMGSLLVVLVIFSRSAKQAGIAAAEQARVEAAAAAAARREELELARDELGWRIDHVRGMRDRTAEDLAKARMQLAGTEENARQLADELDALARVIEALEGTTAAETDGQAIIDLERRLAEARAALDDAKEKLADRPPAYAVVPYEGANGTHRRPLYIECCIDGVFLQPEGIRLGPADFEGPPGPGNPLASALRAAREHIARNPGESGDPNVQPYPLLLVRPSGVMAYYAARESIQSWGSEFGYQFVDEEWTLNYPPRDAALADAEMRAIDEARRRLEWLAQVRPPKRTKPATQYRASTTRGGVVSNSGPSVLGDQSRFDWTEDKAGDGGGGASPGRGLVAGGDGGDGGLAAGEGGGDPVLGNRYSGPSKFYSGGPGGGAAADGLAGGAAGDGGGFGGMPGMASGSSGAGGLHDAPGGSDAPGGQGQAGSSGAAGSWDGLAQAGATAASSATATGAGSGASQASGTAGSGAAGTAGGGTAGGGAGGSAGGALGSAAGGGGGGGPSMPGLAHGGGGAAAGAAGASGASASVTGSLAGKRGSNWASLATMETPVPLTRPIRVECAADEFRILADGGRVETRIPIGTHTVDSIDPLVREVHAAVGRWGLAGERMYWKPELVLSATADGAGRREDLEKLLADSGIDTRRSEVKDKVRYLPPVQRTGGLFPRR